MVQGDFAVLRLKEQAQNEMYEVMSRTERTGYLIRYKLNLDKVMPEYLYVYTRLDEYWNWVRLNQSGAAQPGINAKKYGSLLIPVAPLAEQRTFQAFVKQVDKSKVAVQEALDKAQLLFDSLMQRYFG